MKKLIYLLMAVLVLLAAASCKKDDKPANGDTGNNDAPEIIVPEEAVDLGMVLPRLDDEGNPLKDEQGNEITYKLYWAKSNLCETGLCAKPGDYGDYYAWGETEPYYEDGYSQVNPCSNWRVREDHPITGYNWVSYKFRTSGDSDENVILSKYNTMDSVGPVDNITELQRGEKTGQQPIGEPVLFRAPHDVIRHRRHERRFQKMRTELHRRRIVVKQEIQQQHRGGGFRLVQELLRQLVNIERPDGKK